MSTQSLATLQFASLTELRSQTLQLFDLVTSDSVLRREPVPGFRPLLWHLAHIGVYQNYWILQRAAGQPSINPTYDIHFDPIKTPREEARQLPSRAQIELYLNATLQRVEEYLAAAAERPSSGSNGALSASYAVELSLEHERQHQETVAFLLQGLPYSDKATGPAPPGGTRRQPAGDVLVRGGAVVVGAVPDPFAYDNELPAHTVEVKPFYADRDLTSNAEYAEFVEQGGYNNRAWWSDEGWSWKGSENISLPLYWSGPPWEEQGFFARVPLRGDAPVSGISWYEADAYARFRGKRLLTEFEWEAAASWDTSHAHKHRFAWGDDRSSEARANAEHRVWGTTAVGAFPAGDSVNGLSDANGNLWEWTSSDFRGYPGFAAYPYPEYSAAWFDGDHKVSRGGSWFSATPLLRTSFRNFYRRQFRRAFIGVRCARDAR